MIKLNLIKNKISIIVLLFIISAGSFGCYSYYQIIKNNELTRLAESQRLESERNILENNVDVEDKLINKITPDDQNLYFAGKNFGSQHVEYTNDTGVWNSYYALNGQGIDNPDEELMLNFYLKGVWTNELFTAQSVAQLIADSYIGNPDAKVIKQFNALDDITKLPNYFIVSNTIYDGYAYVYMMKISSFENNVFSAIYSKKFAGDNINLENDINNWIINDVKLPGGVSRSIADIGVDSSWLDYFANHE